MIEIEKMLAYTAGLIDGEGCITMSRRGQLTLVIAMCSEEVLKYAASTIGGSVHKVNNGGFLLLR